MPLPFHNALDRQLIKLVEQNPILYDTGNQFYLESDVREKVWTRIGQELDVPARACKTRWINIRDNMRRTVRRDLQRKALGIENSTPRYKTKYEDLLAFLIPFFRTNAPQSQEKVRDDINNEDSANNEDMDATNMQDAEQSQLTTFFNNSVSALVSDSKSDVLTDPLIARDCPPNTCSTLFPATATSDSINIFLDAVGTTLRNLNPYYLNVAKSKIFQVAQECELQQIVNNGEHPPST